MYLLLGLFLSYLLGAIPVGILVARKYGHPDLTQKGSGNIGATNVARSSREKSRDNYPNRRYNQGIITSLIFLYPNRH
ncbi:MAG: Glycerol-3-phosphate acyltransferase [Candidatus Methanoperedenaceae archaeon GB37]|nr:MAG: Glycerol-3-phosphate acyltransferase [Candidatus Methanoperedenaceae archaeon GB37]